MYTLNDLTKYEYFKDIKIEHALDSLTGVLARNYIIGFAKKLIEDKTPFSLYIMDIDNFKQINDNYGHMAGDVCLMTMGRELIDFVGNRGLVGRFGGDEFIIINLKVYDYDNVYGFLAELCESRKVIRRSYQLDNIRTYVTGTIGCASYPKDAKNYEELFIRVDKALYRGKTKGRNCFIVYVHEKHKNIDVHRREATSLPVLFNHVDSLFLEKKSMDDVIKSLVDYVNETLQLSLTCVITYDDNRVISSEKKNPYYYERDYIDAMGQILGKEHVYASNDLARIKDENKYACEYLTDRNIQSIVIAKIETKHKLYGYFMTYENKITRIWQENDVALALYIQKLLAILFMQNEKK